MQCDPPPVGCRRIAEALDAVPVVCGDEPEHLRGQLGHIGAVDPIARHDFDPSEGISATYHPIAAKMSDDDFATLAHGALYMELLQAGFETDPRPFGPCDEEFFKRVTQAVRDADDVLERPKKTRAVS